MTRDRPFERNSSGWEKRLKLNSLLYLEQKTFKQTDKKKNYDHFLTLDTICQWDKTTLLVSNRNRNTFPNIHLFDNLWKCCFLDANALICLILSCVG